MTTDYRPIACDQHSVLELLAMRRRPVRIQFCAADASGGVVEGVVFDVLARDGAEFLIVEVGAERLSVRLDRLEAIHDGDRCVYRRQKSDGMEDDS